MRALMGLIKDRHGTYYAQQKVPERLQAAVAHYLGNGKAKQVYQKKSLGTKDLRTANVRAKPVLAEFDRVLREAAAFAASRSLPFRATGDGETVQGVFKETVQLSSGKFALVENAHEFTLVPWRPVIENRLGREVMGVVQGGSVSWQLERKLGLGLI